MNAKWHDRWLLDTTKSVQFTKDHRVKGANDMYKVNDPAHWLGGAYCGHERRINHGWLYTMTIDSSHQPRSASQCWCDCHPGKTRCRKLATDSLGSVKASKGDDDWSLGEKGRGRWVSTKSRNQWRVRCRFQSIRRGQQFWIAMRSRSRWFCRPCRGHSQVREEQ